MTDREQFEQLQTAMRKVSEPWIRIQEQLREMSERIRKSWGLDEWPPK